MATIRQVAARAGVSTATVSYVLNGQGSIPAETRERVWQAVRELDYQPSHAARAMRGRSHTLGVSMASGYDRLADPATAEVLAGMAQAASQQGLGLLLIPMSDDLAKGCVTVARSGQVDGIVICDPEYDDVRIAALTQTGIAHVSVGQQGAMWVASDVTHGMHLAVSHLVSVGYRDIALIAPDPDLASSDWYVEGFVAALEQHHLELIDGAVLAGGRREIDGSTAMAELLALPQLPTAVIAASDELAYGAMRTIADAGLVVGRDMAVIGFDDLPPAAYLQPPLTAIHQPRFAVGVAAVALLEAVIRGDESLVPQQLLTPKLMIRGSTPVLRLLS
jgi:DNA-binding LacI/PurR family transcriptional regulator